MLNEQLDAARRAAAHFSEAWQSIEQVIKTAAFKIDGSLREQRERTAAENFLAFYTSYAFVEQLRPIAQKIAEANAAPFTETYTAVFGEATEMILDREDPGAVLQHFRKISAHVK